MSKKKTIYEYVDNGNGYVMDPIVCHGLITEGEPLGYFDKTNGTLQEKMMEE